MHDESLFHTGYKYYRIMCFSLGKACFQHKLSLSKTMFLIEMAVCRSRMWWLSKPTRRYTFLSFQCLKCWHWFVLQQELQQQEELHLSLSSQKTRTPQVETRGKLVRLLPSLLLFFSCLCFHQFFHVFYYNYYNSGNTLICFFAENWRPLPIYYISHMYIILLSVKT